MPIRERQIEVLDLRPAVARPWPRKALTLLVLAAIPGMCFPPVLRAEVKDVAFKDFVVNSDPIVVAKVTKVEAGPAQRERIDPMMPALRFAIAQVIETWKGTPARELRFVASSSWVCDTSSAEEGERVVLFLARRKDSTIMSIAHAGRGRMPLREVGAKSFAVLQHEIILPTATPTISEQKSARWSLAATRPGKPATPLTFTYSEASIELGVLRRLVRSLVHSRNGNSQL